MNHSNREPFSFSSICITRRACEMHEFLLERMAHVGDSQLELNAIAKQSVTWLDCVWITLRNWAIFKWITLLAYRVFHVMWCVCVCGRSKCCCAWQMLFAMWESLSRPQLAPPCQYVKPKQNIYATPKVKASLSFGLTDKDSRDAGRPEWVTNNNLVISWQQQLFYHFHFGRHFRKLLNWNEMSDNWIASSKLRAVPWQSQRQMANAQPRHATPCTRARSE